MVMGFSVKQKPQTLVNDDQFPALAITRNSRDHTKVAQSREFRRTGRAVPAQCPTPSGEPEHTLSCGTGYSQVIRPTHRFAVCSASNCLSRFIP